MGLWQINIFNYTSDMSDEQAPLTLSHMAMTDLSNISMTDT